MNGFAVDPTNPKVMYAALRDGIFKSMNTGELWKPLGRGLKNVAAVAVNPKQPREVYAATMAGVLYRSRDGGQTWQPQK